MEQGKNLTRKEFDAVMRRATEFALRDSEPGDLTEADLYRIAREVGVPDRHVRVALAEVRANETVRGPLSRLFGPEVVLVSRVVPGTPLELSDRIDRFLVAGRLLQPVRRGSEVLSYRPAVDWISQVARAASATSRRYYVASAKSVEARLVAVTDGNTLVELRVDPGIRGDAVVGGLLGGAAGGAAAGLAVGVTLAMIGSLGVAIGAGSVVAAALGGGIALGVAISHQKKVQDVRSEVEGILDQLELGEPLEPPPPSWQEWVRRQFHGARKLLGDLESYDPRA